MSNIEGGESISTQLFENSVRYQLGNSYLLERTRLENSNPETPFEKFKQEHHLRIKYAGLKGSTKENVIEDEKKEIIEEYSSLPTSAQMLESSDKIIFLNKEKIVMKNPDANPLTVEIDANIEEAKRLRIRLKELQPIEMRSVYIHPYESNVKRMENRIIHLPENKDEVKKIKAVKNLLGIRIEGLRLQALESPDRLNKFDPSLQRKLNLLPRK